jgi:hypothetical protein
MPDASKLCFVIGPIGLSGSEPRRHADWLLKGIIRPVFSTTFPDFTVQRADEISEPGAISSQVINRLLSADLVIADMSLANPNAFYEMGIRHMKRLPTVHMYLDGQDIPFDVKPYRAIAFKYQSPDDLITAQGALKLAVEEVIKPGFVVDNPVTQARGRDEFEETATPLQRTMLERVDALARQVAELNAGQKNRGLSEAVSREERARKAIQDALDWSAQQEAAKGRTGSFTERILGPVDPFGGPNKG